MSNIKWSGSPSDVATACTGSFAPVLSVNKQQRYLCTGRKSWETDPPVIDKIVTTAGNAIDSGVEAVGKGVSVVVWVAVGIGSAAMLVILIAFAVRKWKGKKSG